MSLLGSFHGRVRPERSHSAMTAGSSASSNGRICMASLTDESVPLVRVQRREADEPLTGLARQEEIEPTREGCRGRLQQQIEASVAVDVAGPTNANVLDV